MKRTILLLSALLSMGFAVAKPVTIGRASDVASFFFPWTDLAIADLGNIYLFTPVNGGGFVLVAGDDCVRPLLAWSPVSTFNVDAMPQHVRQWIAGYSREIGALQAAGAMPSAAVQAEWEYFTSGNPKAVGDSVGPLMTTRWNQAPRYNLLCPYDTYDSMYTYAGCTAVATAQIMKYWNHPAVGMGSYSYEHPMYGTQSARFDTTHYQWSLMPDALTSVSDSAEIMAVAQLLYHVGVAVRMNYGTRGSGAAVNAYGTTDYPSSETALKKYFKYNPMLRGEFKSGYDDVQWDSLMACELDAGRPVLYSGYDTSAGHAFVLDGYRYFNVYADSLDTVGTPTRFFHVNWGWGGAYDGYYMIDSLSPGAGGIGGNATYTFNANNSAIVGIYPIVPTSDSVARIYMLSSNLMMGYVSGSGNYVPMQDTVMVWAHASEGCRFVRWASGSTQNPLQFIAIGDITDTAVFERISGDTLAYCNSGLYTAWRDDYVRTTEWGIRLPASMRNVGRMLSAVQFYPYVESDHTLRVYVGDSICPATLVHTQTLQVGSNMRRWNTYTMDSTIVVPDHATLWITISCSGDGYPASMARYSGNSDGSWYKLPWGWVQFDVEGVIYGTWMLRALMEPREFTVTVQANDSSACSVFGSGTYHGGEPVTIGAVTLIGGCSFLRWSDGTTDNPYTFTATSDTVMVAYCSCDNVGISDIDGDDLVVSVVGHTVSVSADAMFYDIAGRLLARGRKAVMPAAGVYIVRVGETARKVVVM